MSKALRAVWSFGFAITLTSMFMASSPLSAETIVNNVLSPFSTIQIVGSRPGPRPPFPWSPECNQGFSEWRPVCAVTRNRITITYSNKCMAELDGAITLYDEECPRRVSCSTPMTGMRAHQPARAAASGGSVEVPPRYGPSSIILHADAAGSRRRNPPVKPAERRARSHTSEIWR